MTGLATHRCAGTLLQSLAWIQPPALSASRQGIHTLVQAAQDLQLALQQQHQQALHSSSEHQLGQQWLIQDRSLQCSPQDLPLVQNQVQTPLGHTADQQQQQQLGQPSTGPPWLVVPRRHAGGGTQAAHAGYHSSTVPFSSRSSCISSSEGSSIRWQLPGPHSIASSSSSRGYFCRSSSSVHTHHSSGHWLPGPWGASSSPIRWYSSRAAALSHSANILEELGRLRDSDETQGSLTPAAVVERLDRVIIGQEDAKKAVAIAFRNRWRRQRVADPEMRREITPKNLLLIGPTGCGKTEIARRLAKLAEAPFVKVEATKFTEVGYHGRDVDQIIRDLVEAALALVKKRCRRVAASLIAQTVEQRILSALLGENATFEQWREMQDRYRSGDLDDQVVSIDVPSRRQAPDGPGGFVVQGGQLSLSVSMSAMFGGPQGGGGGKERRSLTVSEARELLEEAEAEAVLPAELLAKEAVRVAEQEGIVFIDEIDKIVNPSGAIRHGSDPSAEGVQRDLLPLIEGSVVTTKHGPVATDHILFIASGAFTAAKPSDMMAELQGRLPIRVELRALTAQDFERILTEPECNMIYQQQRLLSCEGVKLEFTPEAIREVAALAEQINKEVENIGARRLHTVLECLVEDVSFEAPDMVAEASGQASLGSSSLDSSRDVAGQGAEVYTHVIDKADVEGKLERLLQQQDLSKYIL